MITLALAVPPASGVAIKLWLDAHRQPTQSWLSILASFVSAVILTVILAVPLIVLAALTNRMVGGTETSARRWPRQWVFGGAAVGMVVTTTLVSVQLLWRYDPFYSTLAAPLMWHWLAIGALFGAAACLVGAVSSRRSWAEVKSGDRSGPAL